MGCSNNPLKCATRVENFVSDNNIILRYKSTYMDQTLSLLFDLRTKINYLSLQISNQVPEVFQLTKFKQIFYNFMYFNGRWFVPVKFCKRIHLLQVERFGIQNAIRIKNEQVASDGHFNFATNINGRLIKIDDNCRLMHEYSFVHPKIILSLSDKVLVGNKKDNKVYFLENQQLFEIFGIQQLLQVDNQQGTIQVVMDKKKVWIKLRGTDAFDIVK